MTARRRGLSWGRRAWRRAAWEVGCLRRATRAWRLQRAGVPARLVDLTGVSLADVLGPAQRDVVAQVARPQVSAATCSNALAARGGGGPAAGGRVT